MAGVENNQFKFWITDCQYKDAILKLRKLYPQDFPDGKAKYSEGATFIGLYSSCIALCAFFLTGVPSFYNAFAQADYAHCIYIVFLYGIGGLILWIIFYFKEKKKSLKFLIQVMPDGINLDSKDLTKWFTRDSFLNYRETKKYTLLLFKDYKGIVIPNKTVRSKRAFKKSMVEIQSWLAS